MSAALFISLILPELDQRIEDGRLFRRLVVQVLPQPPLDLGLALPFPFGAAGDLVAVNSLTPHAIAVGRIQQAARSPARSR